MIATVEIITEKYDLFNKLYFEGKMHRPKIVVFRGTGKLGGYFPKRRRMEITKGIDFEEKVLDSVILHEMVHQYVYYLYKDEKLGHGKIFQTEMKRLNKQYNLNIKIYFFRFKYLKNQNAIQTIGNTLVDCIFWLCYRIYGLFCY